MKKDFSQLIKALIILLLISFLFACNTGSVNNSNIYVRIRATPWTLTSVGDTDYGVDVRLEDNSASSGIGDFSDVIINVNGVDYSDPTKQNFWSTGSIITVGEGDSITVKLSHPAFGTMTSTGIVPPPLIGETITPAFPGSGVTNTQTTYSVTWPAIAGVDKYNAVRLFYADVNGDNYINGFSQSFISIPYVFDVTDNTNTPYPYLQLYIQSLSSINIPGFATDSELTIAGPDMPLYMNYN